MAAQDKPFKIVLDATHEACALKVFSISMLERNLRLLALFDVKEAVVLVSPLMKTKNLFREDFGRFKSIDPEIIEVESSLSFLTSLPGNETIVFLEAHAVFQESLVEKALLNPDYFIYCSSVSEIPLFAKTTVSELVRIKKDGQYKGESIPPIHLCKQNVYMRNLRKTINPYAFYVRSETEAKKAEQFLFEITHYGSIDIVAKHFFKSLARFLTRHLSRTNITPNQITYSSILIAATVPLFFGFGFLEIGILAAILVSILDVCDGKLARFTYRTSEKGDKLDHVADRLNIFLYYITFGIGMWKRDSLSSGWQALELIVAVVALHLIHRLVIAVFKARHKIRIHDYSGVDAKARLFLPRRNIFLCFMTIGLFVDQPVMMYMAYAIWMVVYILFHGWRVIQEKSKTDVAARGNS